MTRGQGYCLEGDFLLAAQHQPGYGRRPVYWVEGPSTGNEKASLFKSLGPWLGRASKDVLGHARPEYSDPLAKPPQLGEGLENSLRLLLVILDSVGLASHGAQSKPETSIAAANMLGALTTC